MRQLRRLSKPPEALRRFGSRAESPLGRDANPRTHRLVDILRGSLRQEIRREGYDLIPTFGVGADLSREEWLDYTGQMIQLGLFEIAYDRGNVLAPTPLGLRIMRGEEKLELSEYVAPRAVTAREAARAMTKAQADASPVDEALLDHLKSVRLEVAKAIGKPAYVVFSDASLEDMARRRPRTREEFLEVHGVGEIKAAQFGPRFLRAIAGFRCG